jgi:hypothetical protein
MLKNLFNLKNHAKDFIFRLLNKNLIKVATYLSLTIDEAALLIYRRERI